MKQLTLKSKLTELFDYKSIDISQFAIPLKADLVRYERDLGNFCKRFAQKVEAKEIAPQDIVTLSCTSANPKFQKEHITVRIGIGLYSKELEQKLIGMLVGTTETVTVGADAVMVSIEKNMREMIPELTDELVASAGVPFVKTVKDIYTYCRFKQYDDALEENADDAAAYLANELINRSTFYIDEEELGISQQHVSDMMNFDAMKAMVEEGEDAELMTCNMLTLMSKNTLLAAVVGQEFKPLTEADYEDYLQRRAVATQRSLEDVRRENPLTLYLLDTYNDIFTDTLEGYVLWKLKQIGEIMADET